MITMMSRYAVFCAVVERGSFTAAAAALNYSQSAVSQAVKALEQELGAALISRETRRLTLTRDGEGFTEHMDTVHTVDPLDRMPELRTLAREAAANRADGKIIRHIAGHTEAIDAAKRAGDYYSLYRVEGSAFGDFSCYRVGHAPYNGTLYLPAGFHDYGIATVDELFVALVVGRCEFLCEYQDEIDEVYHGLFEKRI